MLIFAFGKKHSRVLIDDEKQSKNFHLFIAEGVDESEYGWLRIKLGLDKFATGYTIIYLPTFLTLKQSGRFCFRNKSHGSSILFLIILFLILISIAYIDKTVNTCVINKRM